MSNKKDLSLEDRLGNLEEIINKMENSEVTLDEAFTLYKQGIEETKEANEILDKVEKAMLVVNENGDLEEF